VSFTFRIPWSVKLPSMIKVVMVVPPMPKVGVLLVVANIVFLLALE